MGRVRSGGWRLSAEPWLPHLTPTLSAPRGRRERIQSGFCVTRGSMNAVALAREGCEGALLRASLLKFLLPGLPQPCDEVRHHLLVRQMNGADESGGGLPRPTS